MSGDQDLVDSVTAPGLRRVSLRRYLEDKVQCVAERSEARDLVDIGAVLQRRRELELAARQALAAQDAILLAERLQAWTDAAIAADLEGYPDVDPAEAARTRDLLLAWLKALARRGPGDDG